MRTSLSLFIVAALVSSSSAQELCRQAPLEPTAGIHSGGIDVDGRWLAARAGGPNQEWIEVRRKFGPRWLDAEVLQSPDLPGSQFGHVVDVQVQPLGLEVMAATPGASFALGTGVVRRFIRGGGGWSEVPPFRSSDPDAQQFGTNLARDGDVAVAQSMRFLFASTESQLHVFEPLGAISWLETARIDHPDPNGDRTRFGEGLAVGRTNAATLIAASAPLPFGAQLQSGRAWLWRHVGTGQLSAPVELVPTHAATSEYGAEIAIWNGLVAVSDPAAEGIPGLPGSGVVAVFAPSSAIGQYIEVASLVAPMNFAADFGRSLDFEEGRLGVSFAVPASPILGRERDALAVFEGFVGGPLGVRTVIAALGDPVTAIGRRVAVGAGEAITTDVSVLVGGALRPEPALRRFALEDPAFVVCDGLSNSTGVPAVLDLDGCALVDDLPLRADRLPPNSAGVVILGTRRASIPVGMGRLCIEDPVRAAIAAADAQGTLHVSLDPSLFGFAVGDVPIAQLWYRDGPISSNLTSAVTFELAN